MLDHVGSSVAARYWRIAGSVAVICAKLTTGELWGIPAANYSESQFLGPSFPASGWATETFWVLVLHCFHTRHVTESRAAYFACSVKQKLLGHISSCTLLFTSCVLQAACWGCFVVAPLPGGQALQLPVRRPQARSGRCTSPRCYRPTAQDSSLAGDRQSSTCITFPCKALPHCRYRSGSCVAAS